MTSDLNHLVERIRSIAPDLSFETARLSPTGEDHIVVILDQAWAFRFPRSPEQAEWFPTEVRMLATLAERSPLATPRYRYLSPAADFGGYPLVRGEEMSVGDVKALTTADQEAILGQLAEFLSVLHALPPSVLVRGDGQSRTNAGWAREAAGQYRHRYRPRLAAHAPATVMRRLDAFHETYGARTLPSEAVIHGDLREDHLLMAPGGRRLAGVIDFGDTAIGDPAYDFGVLWLLGEWAPAFVCGRYARVDDGLLERSRWSFLRYVTGLLARALDGDPRYSAELLLAEVRRQLDAIDPSMVR